MDGGGNRKELGRKEGMVEIGRKDRWMEWKAINGNDKNKSVTIPSYDYSHLFNL